MLISKSVKKVCILIALVLASTSCSYAIADMQEQEGQYLYAQEADGICLVRYLGREGDTEVPKTIRGMKVVSIGSRCFANNVLLSRVSISKYVVSIARDAFEDSPNVSLNVCAYSYAEEYAKTNGIPYVLGYFYDSYTAGHRVYAKSNAAETQLLSKSLARKFFYNFEGEIHDAKVYQNVTFQNIFEDVYGLVLTDLTLKCGLLEMVLASYDVYYQIRLEDMMVQVDKASSKKNIPSKELLSFKLADLGDLEDDLAEITQHPSLGILPGFGLETLDRIIEIESAIDARTYATQNYKNLLCDIAEAAGQMGHMDLKSGTEEYIEFLNSQESTQWIMSLDDIANTTVKEAAKFALEKVIKGIADHYLASAMVALGLTSTVKLSEFVTGSWLITSTIIDQIGAKNDATQAWELITVTKEVEDVFAALVRRYSDTLCSVETYGNALNYHHAYEMYKAVEFYAYDLFQTVYTFESPFLSMKRPEQKFQDAMADTDDIRKAIDACTCCTVDFSDQAIPHIRYLGKDETESMYAGHLGLFAKPENFDKVGLLENEVELQTYRGSERVVIVPPLIDYQPVQEAEEQLTKADREFMPLLSLIGENTIDGSRYGYVTHIGMGCFAKNENVNKIILPEGITTIGELAFSDCPSLQTLVIPRTVKQIKGLEQYVKLISQFPDYDDPASSVKGNPVLNLEVYAGSYGEWFARKNEVPYRVISDNTYAFLYEGTLGSQTGIPENPETDFSFIIQKDGAALTGYKGDSIDIRVPDQLGGQRVTAIADGAFKDMDAIVHVSLPDSIISIGNHAFAFCDGLMSVDLPESMLMIDEYAFADCSLLYKMPLPESLQTVGYMAFRGCPFFELDPRDTIVTQGGCLLRHIVSQENDVLIIPDGVHTIQVVSDSLIFGENKACIPMVILPESLVSIGKYAFEGFQALRWIDLPKGLVSIGESAFAHCKSMHSLLLPDNLEEMNNSSFEDTPLLILQVNKDTNACRQVSTLQKGYILCVGGIAIQEDPSKDWVYHSVDGGIELSRYSGSEPILEIPANIFNQPVLALGNAVCSGNENLVSVLIPDVVQRLGEDAFRNCKNLQAVHLPKNLEQIGNRCFAACVTLREITLPSGVITILDDAFGGCTSLEMIILPESLQSIGANAFQSTGLKNIRIPSEVTSIGKSAFSSCAQLSNVEILCKADLPENCFANCTLLSSVDLTDAVTGIGRNAFSGCTSLTEMEIPPSVRSIDHTLPLWIEIIREEGTYAQVFTDQGRRLFRQKDQQNANDGSTSADAFEYQLIQEEIVITRYVGSNQAVIVPTQIDGHPVTSIGKNAFAKCINVMSITLQEGIRRVDSLAFWGCDAMKTLELPVSLQEIAAHALRGCIQVTLVVTSGSYAERYAIDDGFSYQLK